MRSRRNSHHFLSNKASFQTPDAKELRNHGLMVASIDVLPHRDYHADFRGLSKQPHALVVNAALESLYAIEHEEPTPPNVAEYLAYSLGALSLMDERRDVQRSAQNMQQLLLNQIPYLIKGKASY